MDSVPDQQTGGHERDALADVSMMSLPELIRSNDSVLANSLRRLLDDQIRTQPEVARFGNYPL
jgi:hypothetical protein